jgi:hypothetical protein
VIIVNNNLCIVDFKIASIKDLECSKHKEVKNVGGNRYAIYPDLIIAHYLHELKWHTISRNMYNYYVSENI